MRFYKWKLFQNSNIFQIFFIENIIESFHKKMYKILIKKRTFKSVSL